MDPLGTVSGIQGAAALWDRLRGQRIFFERPNVTLCNWSHPIMTSVDTPSSEERGPWHLDVRLWAWTPGPTSTTVQNARARVGRLKLVSWEPNYTEDYQFQPFELAAGAAKTQAFYMLNSPDTTLDPTKLIDREIKLMHQISDGRWRSVKTKIEGRTT